MKFKRIKTLHFVGIGGTGMCGIAEILHNSGYKISGSDQKETETTDHLASLGISIKYSHEEANIKGSDVVVISSAVSDDNPEVIEARREKIPVIRRAEMLGELMRTKFSIAVAGTHGKTTTTSLIGHILKAGGLDPTVIVGGRVLGVGSNAYLGKSEYLVAEADEFDRSILKFYATIAVITNIEAEHMECYSGIEDLENCFVEFANRVPFFGTVILCADDAGIKRIHSRITRPILTYGLESRADYSATEIQFTENGATFTLVHNGSKTRKVESRLMGYHNIRNLLAGFAVADDLEIPIDVVLEAAKTFTGVGRRLELAGEAGGAKFYDDYGHHPTEIRATLEGVRSVFGGRLVAVLQPHLFSRTQKLYKEFGAAFFDADMLVVLNVYPSREKPIDGVSGKLIADAARQLGHKNVLYVENKDELPNIMRNQIKSGDRVVLFGAGDINRYTQKILEKIRE